MVERLIGNSASGRIVARGNPSLVTTRGPDALARSSGLAAVLAADGVATRYRIGPIPVPKQTEEISATFDAEATFVAAVEDPNQGGSFDTNWWWM